MFKKSSKKEIKESFRKTLVGRGFVEESPDKFIKSSWRQSSIVTLFENDFEVFVREHPSRVRFPYDDRTLFRYCG
jgi:hypothetical protein